MEHAGEALELPMFLPTAFRRIVVDIAGKQWTMKGSKPY
jgi:hypothetical protein